MKTLNKIFSAILVTCSLTAVANANDITLINKTDIKISAYFDFPEGKQLKVKLPSQHSETVHVEAGKLRKIQLHPKSDKVRGQYIFPDDSKEKQTYTLTISGEDIVVMPS